MDLINLILIIAMLMCAAAAFTDIRWGKIPNVVPLFGALAGLGVNMHHGFNEAGSNGAFSTLFMSVAGGILAGAVPWVIYRKGAMGAGDVKLIAALGVIGRPLIGLELTFAGLLFATIVLLPVKLAYEGRLWSTVSTSAGMFANALRPADKKKEVSNERTWFRLGPALLLGSLWITYLRWGQQW